MHGAGVVRGVTHMDGHLARRAANGDRGAFRSLVEGHYDACLRFARLRLGDPQEAEDVVQETFVRAHRALARYEDDGRFRSWLFKILVNRCNTAGRRMKRRADVFDGSGRLAGAAVAGDEANILWRADIERALGALSEPLREAFLLRFVEDMSYEEMADATGAKQSALKMRVSRARDQLRENLQGAR